LALAALAALACSRAQGAEAKAAPAPTASSTAGDPNTPPPQSQDGASDRLLKRFEIGDFQGVSEYCRSPDQNQTDDVRTWCTSLIPAALHALGRAKEGLDYSEQYCNGVPPADTSDARAAHIVLMMLALSQAAKYGNYHASKAERDELFNSWLDACVVPPEQVQQVLRKLTEPR